MIHAEFDELSPGDRVRFEGNDTTYTVLELRTDFYYPIEERIVYLTPDDDSYVRKVGMYDADAKQMHRVESGKNLSDFYHGSF